MIESTTTLACTACYRRKADGSLEPLGAGTMYFLVDGNGMPHVCRYYRPSEGNAVAFPVKDLDHAVVS